VVLDESEKLKIVATSCYIGGNRNTFLIIRQSELLIFDIFNTFFKKKHPQGTQFL